VKQQRLGRATIVLGDCFAWLARQPPCSVHAVVTDPPYGLFEYSAGEQRKLRAGKGGVWRIPPVLDGSRRSPLPRFTVLSDTQRAALEQFFDAFARAVLDVLVPGGHMFIATNPLLSHHVYVPTMRAGFEKRGEVIRLVQTLRGGDRPKNAHAEFEDVTVMPRASWEPWGLFRKPCEGRVQDNLRSWKTGGLRRISQQIPFCDVIRSAPTRARERALSPHPSLKPQAFMRQLVRAALPLGEGVVLDPFMGGGSTIAAAEAVGYRSIGVEMDARYFELAAGGIPQLARLRPSCASARQSATPSQPADQQRDRHQQREHERPRHAAAEVAGGQHHQQRAPARKRQRRAALQDAQPAEPETDPQQ
jgi:site-specific DNA-methyltransferase (adenine-specific)